MSELAFCKSFLTALDARPVKLSSDHIADARQYPAQGAYTLPRLPHPPHPRAPKPKTSNTPNASSTAALNITLKPMKPSHPTTSLPISDPSKSSIYDLKIHYATHASLAASKIKILYKKKPVPDSKTVAEVLGENTSGDVEFGVMVMAGAAVGTPVTSPPAVAPSEAEKGLAGGQSEGGPAAQGPSGKDVVATDEFWSDLRGFILQRTRDEAEAERLGGIFRSAWESNK
ncbi:cell-cycle control medial ring component [Paraphoma chrysanthemicola]|nr:cell-cycle control medial ring component [Paraphoma chrysanthemicola]